MMKNVLGWLGIFGPLLCLIACESSTLPLTHETSVVIHQPYMVHRLHFRSGISVNNPSNLIVGPDGRVFGCNLTGEIFSIEDTDQDGLQDHVRLFCDVRTEGLRTPTSLAYHDGKFYVGTATEIRIYQDFDGDFKADSSYTFFDDIPFSDHPYEYTSALTFDAKGNLYFALTTDSWNAGASPDPKKYRGAMLRISPDGKRVEQVASGIRSVHGMAFNRHGDLFFVDNQGGQNATEELNRWTENAYYGYHPEKYIKNLFTTDPILSLATEVAPAQISFGRTTEADFLYVAFYGPGEYWQRGGIAKIKLIPDKNGKYQPKEIPLVTQLGKLSGLALGKEGQIYVSQVGKTDYWYYPTEQVDGAIYLLIPDHQMPVVPFEKKVKIKTTADDLALGEKLFAERACSACHSVDGKTELLGPNLKNVGRIYSQTELREEIENPSLRIKPSMAPTKITTIKNETFLGRVIHRDANEIHLMLIGNHIKKLPTDEIKDAELQTQSMMYEGLLTGLEDHEVKALIDYLVAQAD